MAQPNPGTHTIQIGYRTQNSSAITQLLAGTPIHVKSEIEDALNTSSRHSHVFVVNDGRYVEQLLRDLSLTGLPLIQVRLGVINGLGSIQWYPWQEHVLRDYSVKTENNGHLVTLHSEDTLALMDRDPRVRPHRGKISDIARAIVDFYRINQIIEPTFGQWAYVQGRQTDLDFINRLRPRAINESGQGAYRMFMRDNIFHLHSPAYQANLHTFEYYTSPSNEMLFSDKSQLVMQEGSGGVRLAMHNPLTGESKMVESTTIATPRFGNELPDVVGALKNNAIIRPYHSTPNQVDEAKSLAQGYYDGVRQQMLGLIVTFHGGFLAQVGDVVDMVIGGENKGSPWGGLYEVGRMIKTISQGSVTTSMTLSRGEFYVPGANQTAVPGAIPVNINGAEGRPITRSSVLSGMKITVQEGQLIDGSTVKTVLTV